MYKHPSTTYFIYVENSIVGLAWAILLNMHALPKIVYALLISFYLSSSTRSRTTTYSIEKKKRDGWGTWG